MRIKIVSDDHGLWFVSLYGPGGIVSVKNEMIADDFYQLTDSEFQYAMSRVKFNEKDITRLLIPDHSAEVCVDC
jgi:hypothetical protein